MITKEMKQVRCDDSLTVLMSTGSCVFFTLTTPDEVDYHEIRERWRALRHDLLRRLRSIATKKVEYVMNFERHNSFLLKVINPNTDREFIRHSDGHCHGWHIHGVINCFIDLKDFLPLIKSYGFGRTDVRWVTSAGVSEYLTKHALKAYRGLSRREREKYKGQRYRLVNASRGLPALADYSYTSQHLTKVRLRMIDARRNELELREQGRNDLERKDYRVIRTYCEIAELMNVRHNYQIMEMISRMKYTSKKEYENKLIPLTPKGFEGISRAYDGSGGENCTAAKGVNEQLMLGV